MVSSVLEKCPISFMIKLKCETMVRYVVAFDQCFSYIKNKILESIMQNNV